MKVYCKVCGHPADIGSGYCEKHTNELLDAQMVKRSFVAPLDDNEIRISVFVNEEGVYCNAVRGEAFICTTVQPNIHMSLASAMAWIQEQIEAIQPLPEHFLDPVCVCGAHRSEHALCGCGEPEYLETSEATDFLTKFLEDLS